MAGIDQCLYRRILRAGVTPLEVDEEAVFAVVVRRRDRLAYNRDDTRTGLARALGEQLLKPVGERSNLPVGDDRQLVAACLRHLRHHDPDLRARIGGAGDMRPAVVHGLAGAAQQTAEVYADQGRRRQPEVG